ncbi:Tn7-like element transposition protein TnsE [Ferrimonas sediminicola]|uniref:Tn7-like element transposition protein TnsE n=1 Tax=Ferrimonas sediminicola TaxID=2569538 RepID=UPI00389944A1
MVNHLLSGGQIHYATTGGYFTLLEVDTSDADKQLSTKLLKHRTRPLMESQMVELEKLLLKGSLRWPVTLFDGYCGKEQHHWIPHPKSKHKGVLEPDSIGAWAARVSAWMYNGDDC